MYYSSVMNEQTTIQKDIIINRYGKRDLHYALKQKSRAIGRALARDTYIVLSEIADGLDSLQMSWK